MRRRSYGLVASGAVVAASALLGAGLVSAHGGATGIVKERMDAMAEMGRTMKALDAMAGGRAEFDGAAVMRAAHHIRAHGERIPELFPEGTMTPPSEATPEVWTRREEFVDLANQLGAEATKLAVIARDSNRDAMAWQFRRVAKVCSDCHRSFRAKNDGD